MTNILVRPPELRQTAEQLRSCAQKIGQALQALDKDIHTLQDDRFLGNRASTLQSHYQSRRDALQKAKELVLQFAIDLETAANVFEQADKSGRSPSSAALPSPSVPFDSNFWDAFWNLFSADKAFIDIMTTFMNGRGDFKEALKILRMNKSYPFFKDGIPYQGGLDQLFRKFDNLLFFKKLPKGFRGLFLAGVTVGTLEDLIHNTYDNPLKAVGVNTLDEALTVGLSLNPYARVALLVSSGVQLAGNLGLGLERIHTEFIAADDATRQILLDQAQIKASSLEKMDLGNITKSFSESICDGFLFTNEGRSNLLKTAKSTVNVLDGTVEFIDNTLVSSSFRGVAFIDRAIQDTPFLSDEIKNTSSNISHEVLSGVRDYMEEVVNVFEWK
ncbi:MAG TPA: WXG100 family type VII secretion target [Chitinispirillaceae bacterium]|nr:WXG100 family type VII secretion target [Chitinispirillaceae bacterium]